MRGMVGWHFDCIFYAADDDTLGFYNPIDGTNAKETTPSLVNKISYTKSMYTKTICIRYYICMETV
jgi:hypothetical protein